MVTGLVCIWSIDSETDIHKRLRGERVVKTEREMERGGGGGCLHGGDVKSRFSCIEENISPISFSLSPSCSLSHTHTHKHAHTQSVCLPPTVGIPQHLCDRMSLSEECFVRSQGAPHIRGIRLAPVRWAHSVGREDVRRAGKHRLTARSLPMGASSYKPYSPGTASKLSLSYHLKRDGSCSEGYWYMNR